MIIVYVVPLVAEILNTLEKQGRRKDMMKTQDLCIQLIQMIDDEVGPYFFAERAAPPLGLLSIATYLCKYLPAANVEIIDNAVMDTKEVHDRVSADIIGLSVNLWNYEKSLEVARTAKEKGSTVIMGGHHASAVAESILRNREYVDYVIIGDGEEAFFELVNGEELPNIKNLVYRNTYNNRITRNSVSNLALKDVPAPDRSFVDLEPYIEHYKKALPRSPFDTYTTFYSHKGCDFRSKARGCIFCGIQIQGYRVRDPEESWAELSYLSKTYGIKYVMDVGDNLTKGWLREFAKTKPNNMNIAYTGYIRSDRVDEEVAELLAEIPCHSMFIGIESGDKDILRHSGKQIDPSSNLKAVRLLEERGISVRLGIVLGLPGESEKTLGNTLIHIENILNIGKVEGIYTSILVPLPGSPSFTMLANCNGWKEKMLNSDVFDIDLLKQQWANSFTNVAYDRLVRTEEYIESFVTPICQ